jgi:hypothetical protein
VVSTQIESLTRTKQSKEDSSRQTKEDEELHKDHEQRIRDLEKAYWRAVGALAVVQIVVQVAINYFSQ